MKRISLISIFLLSVVIPYCCRAQWSFSVSGNLQFSREKIMIDQSVIVMTPYHVRSKYILLPDVGIHVDYHLSRVFFLRSGIMIDGKGGIYPYPESFTSFHRHYVYLDVPLFFLVNPYIFHTDRFYMGLGPFIGYGLGGWYKNESLRTHQILAKGKVRFRGKDGGFLKDFDNGINFLLGYRISGHFSINFIYQYGLMDIYNGPNTAYDRSIGAGIDYKIR